MKESLQARLAGLSVTGARVLRPIVLRCLAVPPDALPADIAGRPFVAIWRRGKFLALELGQPGQEPPRALADASAAPPDRVIVVNPMLSGGLQLCPREDRVGRRTFLALELSDGRELRYVDQDRMGMVYYATPPQLPQIPRLGEQGPDVLDEPLYYEEFRARLKPFRGEVKGVLTRGGAVSGIGNAYADEVLFAARLFPFRKVTSLSPHEAEALHRAVYEVPRQAVPTVRERMGDDIHRKVRDFLAVHGKGDQPCPNCGARITSITANGFLTNYCRTCQPGSLLRR